jgi:hypothetical protein
VAFKFLNVLVLNIAEKLSTLVVRDTEYIGSWVRVMVFNAAFNTISVILWLSVLLVEESGENHRPTAG